ncbi:MAG: phage portal protein, partial [Veillonella sp.]|nr:phage portal protein [Veillonella sp.]
MTVLYDAVIHIKRHFNTHQLFGEDNSKALKEDLDLLHAVKAAIINSVKNGNSLRGIINFEGTVREDDQQALWKQFTERYVSNANGSGIATLDNKATFQQLTTTISTFNKGQMDFARDMVYKHFGLNEKIVSGDYTEDEYIAFYESVLEPIAIKLTQEFTEKLFTSREKGHGNEIIMESNRLSYMSVASRIKVSQALLPTGAVTVNEIREIFGYEGVEGGDERLVSLNFAKYQDLSEYQINASKGGDTNEEEPKNGTPNDDGASDTE